MEREGDREGEEEVVVGGKARSVVVGLRERGERETEKRGTSEREVCHAGPTLLSEDH